MLDDLVTAFSESLSTVQQWLFEAVVQPLAFSMGLGNLLEDAYDGTGWLLVGLIQLAVMWGVFGLIERWWPREQLRDKPAVRVDILYTLIHTLGLFRVALFFVLEPHFDTLLGWARVLGFDGVHLDALVASWWPGVTDTAWASFLVYLVVFDFLGYWIHRAQHQWRRWWALHALHHSQRQMTRWSDERNHLLDAVVVSVLVALVARVIGVPPGQFVAVVVITRLIESYAHANTRLDFGRWFDRVLVGPKFHRVHHGMGVGHESAGPGSLGGCNYAVLFPIWDILFGTADFTSPVSPTGIRDQLPQNGGRDYGRGFWAQQWLGMRRLMGRN
jgi:sterol desaturase/sphingolipid hydroxylase (fatty acid hydroxylase superfamily)